MAYGLRFAFLICSLALVFVANLATSEGMAFGSSKSKADEFFENAFDVATGKRDLKIKGNVLTGDATITTSYTNEEIMEMVAIGGGILLALVCCGVCFKYCCCPSKQPTVILYQQMPAAQRPNQAYTRSVLSTGVNNMIPMRNQGYSEVQPQFSNTTPPPPYPGVGTC